MVGGYSLGHEAAVVVADAVPYHVVAHLVAAGRVGKPRTAAASRRRGQGGRRSGRSGAAGRGGGGRSERRERRRGRKGGSLMGLGRRVGRGWGFSREREEQQAAAARVGAGGGRARGPSRPGLLGPFLYSAGL